jgi:hypothetical protein
MTIYHLMLLVIHTGSGALGFITRHRLAVLVYDRGSVVENSSYVLVVIQIVKVEVASNYDGIIL